ncbi:hypothetical protein ZWY2020_012526 [Hordeum vulgare]|nr:hypothetical protein ZWY2020_012526 [Hordeum vulgare]
MAQRVPGSRLWWKAPGAKNREERRRAAKAKRSKKKNLFNVVRFLAGSGRLQEECKEFYANSLFVVGEFGGNDYNAPLFPGKGLTEAYKFMPDVIQGNSDGVEELIAEGAVDLIVPGVMPTGCFPVYLNMLDIPAHEYGDLSGASTR